MLAAGLSGWRVGLPAPAGGRGGARAAASLSAAHGTARLSPLRASFADGRLGLIASFARCFVSFKPLRRQRVLAAEYCLL